MSVARAYERAANHSGHIECQRCHAREILSPLESAATIERIVRAFTIEHAHGAVLTVTPLAAALPAPRTARCSRCGSTRHNTRGCTIPRGAIAVGECAWCGAVATTVDEDGDPSCEQHQREEARPEVLR